MSDQEDLKNPEIISDENITEYDLTKPLPVTQDLYKTHKKGNLIAKPTVAPTVPVRKGVKYALLIGINYFRTQNQLNGCINDVINVKDALIKVFGFSSVNIKVLTDDNKNAMPTRKNIIDAINKIVVLLKPGDEFYVHYSGHGTQIPSIDNDEDLNPDTPGQDDVLCPCDYGKYPGYSGFIVDDELRKILVEKIPKDCILRAVFDCCHSGSALDLPYLYKDGESFYAVEPDTNGGDCLLISGCKDSQTSADAYINRAYSGALTWAFLKAVKTAPRLKITWKNLLIIIRQYLLDGGYDQIPMLSLSSKETAKKVVDL